MAKLIEILGPKSFGGFPTPNLQTPTGDTVMDNLFFLTKSEWENARLNVHYDIVIIGSGICSLAVAKQALTNDPSCRILIIERGPFFLPTHFQNLGKPFNLTIAGLLETFPWTVSAKTAQGDAGIVRYQHGMIPYFGGRSVMWSAWCPEPTLEEMHGWPEETVEAARRYFQSAKEVLNVTKADEIDADERQFIMISRQRPIYGHLQDEIQDLLEKKGTTIPGVYRTEAAPMAVDGRYSGVDFAKFSVPAELLSLASKQEKQTDTPLDIVTNCIVDKIVQQDGLATALQTSRGVLSLGDAKLVLAMGTLPPTTLVRNSFPQIDSAGKRFGAHFISAIIARMPRDDFKCSSCEEELEIGAFYIAGKGKDYSQQYHIQMTALSDKDPEKNAEKALRYMPDVVATASMAQLLSSKDHVVFVCAVLGELDTTNPENCFLQNSDDQDLTTNSILHVAGSHSDKETWDAMDEATFGILEKVVCPKGRAQSLVQYWHGAPEHGVWTKRRPTESERRVDILVHECSTLHIGEDESAPVDTNYLLRKTQNVYVTGGALWPLSGSWNPTLTMVALAQHLADQLVKTKNKQEDHTGIIHDKVRRGLNAIPFAKFIP